MSQSKIRRELEVNAVLSALIARTQLGQVLERTSNNSERFLITRRGEAAAVIIGVDDFVRNVVRKPRLLRRLAGQAALSGASQMPLEQIQQRVERSLDLRAQGKR